MSVLRWLWEGWKRLAHRIGTFNTKLLLFVFYYLALGATSLMVRVFQRDLLGKKVQEGSLYEPVDVIGEPMERARRQF